MSFGQMFPVNAFARARCIPLSELNVNRLQSAACAPPGIVCTLKYAYTTSFFTPSGTQTRHQGVRLQPDQLGSELFGLFDLLFQSLVFLFKTTRPSGHFGQLSLDVVELRWVCQQVYRKISQAVNLLL